MTGCARCGGKWKYHGSTILLTDFEERRLKVNVLMCQDCQSVIVVDPERKKQYKPRLGSAEPYIPKASEGEKQWIKDHEMTAKELKQYIKDTKDTTKYDDDGNLRSGTEDPKPKKKKKKK